MKIYYNIIFFLLYTICIFAQQLEIINIKQLKLEDEKNFRSVKFSPNGKYISLEQIDGKNIYLIIYDLLKDKYIKLGINETENVPSFLSIKNLNNSITYRLSWFWSSKHNPERTYFDFIHSPFSGKFHLYRGVLIENKISLEDLKNVKIGGKYYSNFQTLNNENNFIDYPSCSNNLHKNSPLVVLSINRSLYLFDHKKYNKATKLTEPQIPYSDIAAKFSPNDQYIAFTRDSKNIANIGIISRKSDNTWSEAFILPRHNSINVSPEWSPDGKTIAFYSDEGHPGNYSITTYQIDTKEIKELIPNVRRNNDRHNGPSWLSPYEICFVKVDIQKKEPLMYYNLKTKKLIELSTEYATNEDLDVHYISDNMYYIVFTSKGKMNTRDDLIWTKVYLMKIAIK